ncbi:hypothetical protein M406DRAFT_55200 [Cryphonectria parasitica EP155]|uniref:Uncharacterized protein n=1 Tax=Cryphonectria parasitica (strain ATCC 38755 / EP155) TaxID=660469 RepID=A0A9P4Y607_CRYP1|nr:uncharacterized protein M406DRAFT_55200 [Cryphonectria parasitica EP155]KAF3767353.1 hypothetical protein M406DRAFT_55200 [Cryphonectria parasitica EP155]
MCDGSIKGMQVAVEEEEGEPDRNECECGYRTELLRPPRTSTPPMRSKKRSHVKIRK